MLILSEGKISIAKNGDVSVEGKLQKYEMHIRMFFRDLGIKNMTIKYKKGRYIFPSGTKLIHQQQIRNFLINECPIK